MELLINDVRAESAFEITAMTITDNAGGQADSMEIEFDTEDPDFFSKAPVVGDRIRGTSGHFDSGTMFVDETSQAPGTYRAKALAAPLQAKVPHNQGWEDVRLSDLAGEFATRHGMALKIYASNDFRYQRLRQEGRADFDFLRYRCILEGWTMKLFDQKLILYDMMALKAALPQMSVAVEGLYTLVRSGAHQYDGVRLNAAGMTAEYIPTAGNMVLELADIPFFSIGEGERYCRGIYHAAHRQAKRLIFTTEAETPMAAAAVVAFDGEGDIAGKYFVERVNWSFVANTQQIEAGAIDG